MKMKPKIIALAGPSASGKTDLAVKIAKKYNGEIISADSRYVYKEINIASAKPDLEEMQNVPHHLINVCSVTEEYSVGKFVKDADILIKKITASNKIPVVTGGTGLYFRSLRGTFDIPSVLPDYEFRKNAENIQNEALYDELYRLNPDAAKKIHPNNKVKIVRAIEIARANVKPANKDCPYNILWICLNAKNRQYLYNRANLRVDKMFENGLLQEARYLFDKFGQNSILMNTIGLKELFNVFTNDEDINIAKEEIKKNTRRYIKRQVSWFNGEQDLNFVYIDFDNVEKCTFNLIDNFLNE